MNQAAIESGRAEFALNAVKSVISSSNPKTQKEYKAYAKKFPTLVLVNGLAASLAFCLDKGGAYEIISKNVSSWLKNDNNPNKYEFDELNNFICTRNSDEYRVITNEVLRLFEWIKRFSSGMIEGDEA
jgi:CRISPR-associated protein Cmr5